MSEFGELWKHENNQHALVPPKTKCGCPSGGGIENGYIRYPSEGSTYSLRGHSTPKQGEGCAYLVRSHSTPPDTGNNDEEGTSSSAWYQPIKQNSLDGLFKATNDHDTVGNDVHTQVADWVLSHASGRDSTAFKALQEEYKMQKKNVKLFVHPREERRRRKKNNKKKKKKICTFERVLELGHGVAEVHVNAAIVNT